MNANELADDLENWFGDAGFDEHVAMLRTIPKLQEEIEYWKSAFERAMSLYDQVKHLEAQVYGGTTK